MGQKDISPDELMKRLSALESKVQEQSDGKRLEDFLATYGSKFGNDADIARSFMADLDSRGIEASDESVEELLQALRAEVAELNEKISAIVPPTGDMGVMSPPVMGDVPPPPPDMGAAPPPEMTPPPQGIVSDEELKDVQGVDDTNSAIVDKLIGKLTGSGNGGGNITAADIGNMIGSTIGSKLGPVGSAIGGKLGSKAGQVLSDESMKVKSDPNTKRSRYLDALEALGVKQSSDFDTALEMGRELSKIINEQPKEKWTELISKFGIADEDNLKKIINAYTSYGEQDARMRSILSDARIKDKGMNRNLEEEAKLMKLIGSMQKAGFPAAEAGDSAYKLAQLLPHIDIATAAKDPDYPLDEDKIKVYTDLQNMYKELGGLSLPLDYDYTEFNKELSDRRMKEIAGRVGFDEDMSDGDLLELLQSIEKKGPRNASERVLLKKWTEAGRPKDNWSHGTKKLDFNAEELNPDLYSTEDIAAIDQLVSNITSGKSKAFTAEQVPWIDAWLDFKKQRSKTINSEVSSKSKDDDDINENEIIAQALARKY